LAEKIEGNVKLYLIKWDGYPLESSTWEPEENFSSISILQQWQTRKKQEEEGLMPSFDIAGFNSRLEELAKQKEARQRMRHTQREKPKDTPRTPSSNSDSSEAEEVSEPLQDHIGTQQKPKMSLRKPFQRP
jgi:hypothetical protein